MSTKSTSVRVYMYSLHIHSYDQGYDYKNHFSESIYVFAAHTQLWSRLWLQKPLQWEYICIRCTYTAMIKVMITKTTSVRVYMYSLHIHSYDQGYDYKNHFSESIYVFAAHTQLWSRLWVTKIYVFTSVRVYMYSLHIHSYDQGYEYKIYFSESIYVFAAHTQLWSRLWLQKTTSVRVYMYSLHIHSYDQGYDYKNHFSESIYVFAAHTQLWSRLWLQKPLQWEYICIRCTYTAMIKVMSTKSTSVRVYMYSLHIHSYDQGYEFHAVHSQLWSRLWVQNLQWEYICIRCTYTAMIKVMITKTTSVRVYMYSLHIHSYDQGYEYKIYFSESIYVFAAHTKLWSRLWVQKTTSVRVYMYSLHIHSYDQGYDYKNHFSESIYVFAAHTQLWSRLWLQKTTSVRVYMYSLHIHSYDQGYEYKIYFSESIYVFAAHTQLWSRLWLQKPLQWEYICIRCTYTAMIKVMSTKSTSVRVYMYSLHIHSYDQGYDYKNHFSESIYVFAAHTQLWSRLWLQKPLQWEYICIRCTYTAMIKVMITKTTSVRVYMYSLHIHSYDQGYDYKNHFSESIYVFAAHTQLWSRLWVQNLLQWEYICIRCTYTAMIKVMITSKTTSVYNIYFRVYMYSLHIHSYDQGYDQNLLQWEYICIRCTYTAMIKVHQGYLYMLATTSINIMIKVKITKTTSVRVYMYSLHIHSYDQGYEYKIYFSESIYVFAAHTQLWSRLWLQKRYEYKIYSESIYVFFSMIKVRVQNPYMLWSRLCLQKPLHIHSYDQGYDYKNHFSESIYVFAAHTQLWSRLWVQNLLQWEYICIRCTYTAMIKVMITKTTSVRVYMYSLHIHSYDQGYEYKIYFSESIYVFAAHTQLWSRLWLQKPLQWEYICIRCTYKAMIKVMITKTTSVRVYMYSLHIHSYDQGYEYKIYFSESIYVFAAHTQLWSRLWLQKPLQWEYICIRCTYTAMIKVMIKVIWAAQNLLQWEYICIRCTYTAMIKVMITKTTSVYMIRCTYTAMIKVMSTKSTSVRVYMYSLHIHSYDQGYDYKNHFSESIYVFAAHTQLWSRLWLQKPLQWEYIHSYDQGITSSSLSVSLSLEESLHACHNFHKHKQLWSRLWLQKPLQWEYICIRCTYTAMIKVIWLQKPLQWEYICIRCCTYTAMIKVMSTKTTSVRVYMYSLHIHSYDQGYDYKNHFSESIYVFAAHTQLWSRLWLQKPFMRVYMYSLHIHSYDQGYEYKIYFSESIYVFAAHTQLWSRLWVQNLLQWEYICIRCTYTAMIKIYFSEVMITKTRLLQWEYICIRCTYTAMIKVMSTKNHFSESIYVFAAHTQLWSRLWYKIYFSESIYVFAAHTQLWSRLWLQKPLQWEYICIRCTYTAMIKVMSTKSTSVRVYMYSLHIHSYDQGYDYKNHFSESIYVFAAHTQLWSRLWLQKPLQWEYICIRCTYTAMIKVMITKTTSVRVYMYSLHIHSYDQGYDYKNHFSESIYVFAAHTQLWSRLWVQNLLQWEYICIRCTYTAMIKVMYSLHIKIKVISTKSTSVRVYMYSLHIQSYKNLLQWEYICIRCTYTAMIKVMITKTSSVRVYMYSLHIHSYDQGYDYKNHFSESIYVFAAHTQLWSRLWLQKPLQWEYICIRCTYTAMIKVMSTKSTSVRVYMYSLHIHSYDQGYDYKNHFSESIYVFAAHTQLWSRLWLQKPLQWEYICIRCTYTAMIKVMITKTTSVRVYMYSLHIHSYDQGYEYKIYFSESIYVFAAHTQLWSRLWLQKPLQWEYICIHIHMILWLQKPLQWEYICIRCTYTAMIKVMITKTTSVRVYMYSLHIHSYDQGYEYKIYFSESIYVFAAHTQLWSRLWLQKTTSVRVYMYSLHIHSYDQGYDYKNHFSESIYVFAAHTQLWSRLWLQKPLQWEYICIRCTYTAMIKVMSTKTTSVRVYMYSLHIHSYDQGYEYKIYFSESIYVFAAHTQLWSRLWLQKPLQWEYICIRCTYTAMIKVMITKTTSVRVYMYSLHIHSYDQGYEYKIYFSESIYVFAAHTQLWSRL